MCWHFQQRSFSVPTQQWFNTIQLQLINNVITIKHRENARHHVSTSFHHCGDSLPDSLEDFIVRSNSANYLTMVVANQTYNKLKAKRQRHGT